MLQLLSIHPLAHMGQINGLPACHAFATSRPRQQAAQLRLHHGRYLLRIVGHEQLKSQCLQGVARQQGIGLAKPHMHRGLATAQHIVVHAGHVVMHQRVGVNQFHRTGRTQRGRIMPAHRLVGSQHQQRAQTLAAVQHGIAHSLRQLLWRPHTHPVRQGLLNRRQLLRIPGGKGFLTRNLRLVGTWRGHVHASPSSQGLVTKAPCGLVSSNLICSSTADSFSLHSANSAAPRW